MTGSFDTQSSGNDRSYGGADRDRDEDETEIIAADIRITQERLGDTVEEIGERFNPTRLKEELKSDIRDATIGKVENMAQQTADMVSDAQRSLMESIRENPVPVVMVGLGLGWMILNASTRKKRMGARSQYDDYQRRGGARSMYDEQQGDGWSSMYYDDRQGRDYDQQQSGTLDRARDKASDVVDTVKQKTSQLADETQRKASEMGERAEEMASRVADQTRMQTRRVERAFQDNPLVIGAAALALGLAAGLAIPSTETEDELVGETRDELVDKVRDVAEDTKSKVQQVAERVIDQAESTAKDSAHQVGLMS
jgi:gas vesicle protein